MPWTFRGGIQSVKLDIEEVFVVLRHLERSEWPEIASLNED
jgi:hypothetical protein